MSGKALAAVSIAFMVAACSEPEPAPALETLQMLHCEPGEWYVWADEDGWSCEDYWNSSLFGSQYKFQEEATN